ncbi:MAG TPA: DUF5701 family protein [Nocardioidaceae bacterium]|nr:DUF5701 family protein [Nocardioidaceae bacterium]
MALRSTAVGNPSTDSLTELHRQCEILVDKGYPALAGITEQAFRALVAPLAALVPDEDFVLVVSGDIVPLHRLIERTALRKPGFTTMAPDDVLAFRPTPDLGLPTSPAYLVADVDTGSQTLNVRPDDALPRIHADGRTPLTLDEGLAVATQHPEWLRERNCFEMLGSRAGDKRVTGIWVSKGAPRLGWCWGGNPHTWLGMATAARRIG